jgi:hypothetical protein
MRPWLATAATALMAAGLGGAAARAGDCAEYRQVQGWYQRYLHRPADELGLAVWGGQLRGGGHPDAVLAGILGSEEYWCLHGRTAEGFVAGLYAEALGRRACPEEVQRWVCRLGQCGCRETLAREFLGEARRGVPAVAAAAFAPPPPPAYPVGYRGRWPRWGG